MDSSTTVLRAPDSEPSLAQRLLTLATDTIKASLVAACDQRSLTARFVYEALRSVDPHYVPTQIIDGRKPRSFVLQFTRDIKTNRAVIPGFRLVWVCRKGPENDRARDGVLVLTGDRADSFQPADVGHMIPLKPVQKASDTLADMLTRSGLSIEIAADRSGVSLKTLLALINGTGHAVPQTIHQLAILLSATFDDVRSACHASRRTVRGTRSIPRLNVSRVPPSTSTVDPGADGLGPVKLATLIQFTVLADGRVVDVVSRPA